ncbi:hypothetical protein N9B53_00690, partial [Mariniblastus sp.]|nr:hypothetical protein [Mariniblastus sp.]
VVESNNWAGDSYTEVLQFNFVIRQQDELNKFELSKFASCFLVNQFANFKKKNIGVFVLGN